VEIKILKKLILMQPKEATISLLLKGGMWQFRQSYKHFATLQTHFLKNIDYENFSKIN
jgi:hypothetical protein